MVAWLSVFASTAFFPAGLESDLTAQGDDSLLLDADLQKATKAKMIATATASIVNPPFFLET